MSKLTEQEINRQLEDDQKSWYLAAYDGELLPENLIKKFAKAIMTLPPLSHQIHMKAIKQIVSKPNVNLLTNMEVGLIVNVINLTRFSDIHDDLQEAIEFHSSIEAMRIEYNEKANELEARLKKKKSVLMNLAGLNNKTVPFKRPLGQA